MFEDALRYLWESEDRVRTIAIGGLLVLFGPLVVPTVALLGYLVRVIAGAAAGRVDPPAFDEWGDLLVDGVKAFAIALVYGLVPTVVGGAVAVLGLGLGGAGESGVLGAIGLFVGGALWFALALAVAYVVPAALANFSERRRLMDGFAVGELRRVLASRVYLRGWAYAFVLLLAGGVVTGALNGVPVLGTVVSAFVGFYALVAAYHVIGRTWGELRPVVVHGGDVPEEQAAV